jgi:hypothetical protein
MQVPSLVVVGRDHHFSLYNRGAAESALSIAAPGR